MPVRGSSESPTRLPGVGSAAEPVLGREDARHAESSPVQQIDQMDPPGGVGARRTGHVGHGGLVGQHRHAAPFEQREIGRGVGHPDPRLRRTAGAGQQRTHGQTTEYPTFHRLLRIFRSSLIQRSPGTAARRSGILHEMNRMPVPVFPVGLILPAVQIEPGTSGRSPDGSSAATGSSYE